MQSTAILLVEDEPKVAASIRQWLEENGFTVDHASDGAVGRHLAVTNRYDLVLLDINLPFVNGYEVCRYIRAVNADLPIILVTALESMEEKLSGFEAGADDYLVKPFDYRELLVRIRVLLKRSGPAGGDQEAPADEVLRVADLEIHIAFKTVYRMGMAIALTAKEFALLEYLVRRNGRVASRREIVEQVWQLDFDSGTNVVEVYINFLRKKIDRNFDPKLIHTKQGMGYYVKVIEPPRP